MKNHKRLPHKDLPPNRFRKLITFYAAIVMVVGLGVAAIATNLPGAKTSIEEKRLDNGIEFAKKYPKSVGARVGASTVGNESMPPKAKAAKTRLEAQEILAQGGGGSGSNSQFSYDPFGRLVKIVESNGTVRQFVWSGSTMCEERDGSGNVTKRFYDWGEVISGTSYFYTRDQLGSVREMTDSSGNVIAAYSYDAYGNGTKLKGSGPDSDFLYAGYFYHQPSGLYITAHRVYSPKLGRWLSRDPIDDPAFAIAPTPNEPFDPGTMLSTAPVGQLGMTNPSLQVLQSVSNDPMVQAQLTRIPGLPIAAAPVNSYTYVANNPLSFTDPQGLDITPPSGMVCQNDLFDACVRRCVRKYPNNALGVNHCIQTECMKYLGNGRNGGGKGSTGGGNSGNGGGGTVIVK